MDSTEKMTDRLERVDMHSFFLEKIRLSIEKEKYVEAVWIIYSCLEERYFRTIKKINGQCRYSGKTCGRDDNKLALSTKIDCIKRLAQDENAECFNKNFSEELFNRTKTWVHKRNSLMHNLVQAKVYEENYTEFENLAKEGSEILQETYKCCTEFRKDFYSEGYEFIFPKNAMEQCNCNPNNKKKK